MTASPNLGFNLILANQSSKHVTANTALLALEAIASGVVLGIVNSEPLSPTEGDLYIVSATPSGGFTGQENRFAYFYGTTWVFYDAKPNQRLYNSALSSYVAYNGTTWTTISLGGSSSPTTTEGDLIVRGTTVDTRLGVGTNNQVLTVDTAVPGKVKWVAPTLGYVSPTTTKGDLIVRDATADIRQPVGTDGQVLTADSSLSSGIKWATPTPGTSSPTTTEGDLIVRGTSADSRLGIGTDNQVLTVDTSVAGKLKWAPAPAPVTPLTTKGDIFTYATATDRLPVGNPGEVLIADPAAATGLKWQSPTALPAPTGYQIQEFSVAATTPSPSSQNTPSLTNPIIFGTGNTPLPITYNLVANSQITATAAGLYRVSGHVTISVVTAALAVSQIGLNIISGTATKSADILTPMQNNVAARPVVNWSLLLEVTVAPTVFTVRYGATSGSSASISYIGETANSTSRMRLEKIS